MMQVGSTLSIGFSTVLHAMDLVRGTLRVQAALSLLLLLGGAGGVALGGAAGAAWGFAAAQLTVVPVWWASARRESATVAAAHAGRLPGQRSPAVSATREPTRR